MTLENLEKELKENKLASLYLLYGEETFILDTCLKKIKKLFGETMLGINYIQVDETNVGTLINEINMPAFGYDKKLIIVKNTGLASPSNRKKESSNIENARKDLISHIEENIKTIKESIILIIVEEKVTKNKLVELFEKNGLTCNFERLKPIQIASRLKAIAKAYKVAISDSTVHYLIETSGTSMQDLINEIRKLIEYKGEGGEIAKEDIDKLATKNIESVIFDLTDSLGKKEITKALGTLKDLLYNKEPLQKIIITLYNHFKKLYIIKLCENGTDITEALKLKANQMFLISKYKKQAEYFKKQELRTILKELIGLDSNYKQGLIDINIGIEAILCTYCS